MLNGSLNVIDSEQMDLLHSKILQVLETTGLQIQGKFLLEALADAGCKVDFKQKRAWFNPDLVEKQIAAQRGRYKMVRSSLWYPHCREMTKNDVAWPDEFSIDFGYATPEIFDFELGVSRQPVAQDQIDIIKLGNAIEQVKAVNAPLICSDFDTRIETIESARLLLLNTDKPGWVGTSSGKEVKYLAEFAALATENNKSILKEQPPVFVHAYCTTSPLKIDDRSCDVLEEALKYGFPINFASMPILGATTPVTPAGSVIVAACEILGGITAASLLSPDTYFYGTSISAEMDMKSTQLCYSSPAAILTDSALHQLFRHKYELVLNVEPGYVEAKLPGIQAAFAKTFRQMAFSSTVSQTLPVGLLDNAKCFSPLQAMIDLDFNNGMYKFGRGINIDENSMCIDLINKIGFCEQGTYLEEEHTFENFRNILWDSEYLDRSYGSSVQGDLGQNDKEMLKKANNKWRKLVNEQEPFEVTSGFRNELDKIVTAAKTELLA